MLELSTDFIFHKKRRLIAWHPKGVLDLTMATKMVELVTYHEQVEEETFNRFADWTNLEEVQLKFDEVTDLANKRRESYGERPKVKSAFLAPDPVGFCIAFVFAVLMEGSPIKVKVFREIKQAAKWLDVPVKVLRRL